MAHVTCVSASTLPASSSSVQINGGSSSSSTRTAHALINRALHRESGQTQRAASLASHNTDSDPSQKGTTGFRPRAFDEIIQELSPASLGLQPKDVPINSGGAIMAGFPMKAPAPIRNIDTGSAAADAFLRSALNSKSDSKEDAGDPVGDSGPARFPGSHVAGPIGYAKAHADSFAVPVDTQTPLPVPKARLFETANRELTEARTDAISAAAQGGQSQAAATVVIRTGDAPGAPPAGGPGESPTGKDPVPGPNAEAGSGTNAGIALQATEITAEMGETKEPLADLSAGQTAGTIPHGLNLGGAATTHALSVASEGRKMGGTEEAMSVEAAHSAATQTGSLQEYQLPGGTSTSSGAVGQRNAATQPPASAHEPLLPDKVPTQTLRSLSLEFAPDGARDVRVRLSERAGEVHVSLHSADPSIAKNLRDGVTDHTSMLAQAGYDARSWTSRRQQQESSQEREEQKTPKQEQLSGEGGFGGILQQPGTSETVRLNSNR